MAGSAPIWEAASKQYVDDEIASKLAASQFWLPAVETQANLPTINDTSKTWLCRVRSENNVYQCVAGQTAWLLYSENTDFLPTNGKAADSALLNGKADTAFATTASGQDAYNAARLGNILAGNYLAVSTIANGTDLNTLTANGIYNSASSSVTNSLLNSPITGQGFTLKVVNNAGVPHQFLEPVNSSNTRCWYRGYSGGAFTAWAEIATDGNTTLWKTVSAVSITNGYCKIASVATPTGANANRQFSIKVRYRSVGNGNIHEYEITGRISTTAPGSYSASVLATNISGGGISNELAFGILRNGVSKTTGIGGTYDIYALSPSNSHLSAMVGNNNTYDNQLLNITLSNAAGWSTDVPTDPLGDWTYEPITNRQDILTSKGNVDIAFGGSLYEQAAYIIRKSLGAITLNAANPLRDIVIPLGTGTQYPVFDIVVNRADLGRTRKRFGMRVNTATGLIDNKTENVIENMSGNQYTIGSPYLYDNAGSFELRIPVQYKSISVTNFNAWVEQFPSTTATMTQTGNCKWDTNVINPGSIPHLTAQSGVLTDALAFGIPSKTLPTGTDLNTITAFGIYMATSSAVAASLINAPLGLGQACRLEVKQTNDTVGNVHQVLTPLYTSSSYIYGHQFIRSCNAGSWTRWKQLDTSPYSTTEIWTGSYWTDHKPVYRRVFTGTCDAAMSTNKTIGTITALDAMIKMDGFVKYANGQVPINSTGLSCWVYTGGAITENHTDANYNSAPITVIVEYTKA